MSFGTWAAEKSPQRISMAELTIGALAPMQTWIIVSGDLQASPSAVPGYTYILTDPAAPRARLYVSSDVELSVCATTVSGKLIGGDARAQDDFGWIGQLQADPVLAHEQDPPWLAIFLVGLAVLVGLLVRTSYPVFFADKPKPVAIAAVKLHVVVRQGWSANATSTPGRLEIDPGQLVQLHLSDGEVRDLRLHSARSSIEVGRFQRLSDAEPVLLLVAAGGDLTLRFTSTENRDRAYAALAASAALPLRVVHRA